MPVVPVLWLGIFYSCKILNHLLYLIKGAFITCLRKTGEDKMKKIDGIDCNGWSDHCGFHCKPVPRTHNRDDPDRGNHCGYNRWNYGSNYKGRG